MNTIFVLLGVVGLCVLCSLNASAIVRPPTVADLFYPADKGELTRVVTRHLQDVGDLPKIDGRIIALIVPHAGLIYSGPIAAYAYKLLENSAVNKVILCGPSHKYGFEGISIYGPDVVWQTPLGSVACNTELCRALLEKNRAISVIPEAHQQEHCLEVQLPYLQTVLKDFTIVPMIMGRPDHQTIGDLAEALKGIPDDNATVMIASTDWQHFMPAATGRTYDSLGMDCLKKLDADKLEQYLAVDKTQMCGGGAAVSVIKAAKAKGADKVAILKYGDSGDVTGDKSSVVSYVAAVLYKSGPAEKNSAPGASGELPVPMQLPDSDKRMLLNIARKTIEEYLSTGSTPTFAISDNLKQPGAAFVTLTKQGELRGCIGQTVAVQPLYETVAYCAIQAAVADPRFRPVTRSELDSLHIEISVLTPLQKVTSPDEIKVGRDGLMITLGNNRGLLLPQVATEYQWNRTQFLEQTCRKAGLPTDAYKSDRAEIYKFQAIIFDE